MSTLNLPEKTRFDVIVIGAGPAGSMAAYEVARAGFSCLLLERSASPGSQVACGGGVISYAEHLGPDVVQRLPAKVVQRFECIFPDKTVPFETKQQKVLMIPRPELDSFLARRAETAGATLCTRAKALDLRPAERQVVVEHQAAGEERTYDAELIIAADGPSTLARKAGLGFRGGRYARAAAIMVELEASDDPMPSADLVFDPKRVPWGYFWIFPHGHLLNVGLGTLSATRRENMHRALDEFIRSDARLRDRRRLRALGGIIPLRPAWRVYRRGVLVAGDAAGMVNPFTGAGIHHALRCGQIAGRSCAAALRRSSRRCFYGLRLRLSPTYLWLQLMSFAAAGFLALSSLLRRPLYIPVIRALMSDREIVFKVGSKIS